MPFIGKSPQVGAFQLIDSITTSATDTYALTVSSSAYVPESARNLIVSLNGVTQAPETAYTVSGSNIVFASALTASDVIDYILVIGDAVDIGTPSDNTVGDAQLKAALDLSSKTLTFANDQISGDVINGGTISSFASTGIDDNATSTAITIDASENVGVGEPSPDSAFHVNSGIANNTAFFESTDNGAIVSIADNAGSIQLRAIDNGEFVVQVGGDGATTGTNSTEAMRIDSSGKVGIGTDNPAVELDVASAAPQVRLTDTDGGYCEVTNVSGHLLLQADKGNTQSGSYMRFDVDNAERMRIDSSGNVGIGTTSPTFGLGNGLHINPSGYASINLQRGSSAVGHAIDFTNESNTLQFRIGTNFASAGENLLFAYGSTPTVGMIMNSSGNVGIGTTSPSYKLTIGGQSNSANNVLTGSGIVVGTTIGMRERGNTAGIGGGAYASQIYQGNTAGGDLELYNISSTYSLVFGTNATERMRIDSSGNLLVGKNSSLTPGCRFEVATTNTTTNVNSGAGAAISIQNLSTTNNTYSTIYFTNGGGGVDSAIYGIHEVGNGTGTGRIGSIVFATAASGSGVAEKMRIDSNGNLLFKNINDISDRGSGTGTLRMFHEDNISYIISQGTDASNKGQISFRTSDGGTAAERMRIDSSGNLLVGKTSTDYGTSTRKEFNLYGTNEAIITLDTGNASPFYLNNNNGGADIWNQNNNYMRFGTNSTERMRIDASGQILIGTSSVLSGGVDGLHLNTSADTGITFGYSGAVKGWLYYIVNAAMQLQTPTGITIRMRSGGTAGVELTNGGTSWNSLSDEHKKDIIEPITNASEKVSTLRAVIGKFKEEEEGTRRSFLIAQDVQKVLPEAVEENDEGDLLLSYTETIPLLVAAIKEQQEQLNQFKTELAELKGA